MKPIKSSEIAIVATLALLLSGCGFGRTDLLEEQIAELKSEAAELHSKANELDDHLVTINSALQDAENELATLKDALGELDSSVQGVEAKYPRIDLSAVQGAMGDVEIAATNVESRLADARQATGR